ncbi:MAG: PadR family transcriptional regulator [Anaerolineaceae bacterium]|nr:PadR family transcriptional regulator [Anaerolineaceae bacterium]
MKMKLEHYILGLLTVNPRTGYDVKKHLDTEGRFERRRAPLSQIYTTLKRMYETNLVTFIEEERDGKPDLKIYSITPKGKKLLTYFLNSPIKQAFRHSESSLLFRIRYAFLVEPDALIKQIQDEIDFRQEQISRFRHRDRTIESTLLSPDKLAYAQEIENEIHSYGAARMDVYVTHLRKMLTFFEQQNERPGAVGVT